jgi:tetratricopeptide (TPR) repeat protein
MRADANHAAYVRGDKKFRERRYADAAKYFLVALEEWPGDWQAMHALGNCYSEMKKPRKAEKWFREAIEIVPPERRFDLIYNLGNALFDQQRFDEAIEMYRQVPRGHEIWRLAENNIATCKTRLASET